MFQNKLIIFCLCLGVFQEALSNEVTFNNITLHGYSVFVHKFNRTILSSNDVKDGLPSEIIFDAIEITNEKMPILYEGAFSGIDWLDELILERDEITEINPGAFSKLPMIRMINLKNNKLTNIKEGVFNILPVATIDLTNNVISNIEVDAFSNMPNLLNVKLSDNEIAAWNPDWFANTPELTRVSLQNNLIEELPAGASKNLVGKKQYGKVKLTINLIFSYNKIKSIHPDAFKGLTEINNLWLDNNLLEKIPTHIFDNIEIDDLKLNSNKLKCLSDDFGALIKANSTNLDANPWDCECLKKVNEWVQTHGKNVELFYAKLNCDAQRIEFKMRSLEKRLKELKESDQI